MTTRERVIAEAVSWLGTPWRHQARVKGAGVDCAMLLCEVYERVGLVPHVDPRPYPSDWHMHRSDERFLGWLRRYGREIPAAEARPGDVGVWRFGRCYSHGGILVAPGLVVHAQMKVGCVYCRLDEEPLASRPALFFRLRGLE